MSHDNQPYAMEDVPLDVEALPEYLQREFRRLEDSMGRLSIEGVWDDLLNPLTYAKTPAANAPTWTAFGPTGTNSQWAFGIDDHIGAGSFHVMHDIKRGSLMYPHVHWCTDGTDTNTVKWELSYTFAKAHNQEAFPADTVISVEEAASGTAWQQMLTETTPGDAILAPEIDSLIIIDLKRVTNGGTDNADTVFGLYVDLHFQRERLGTKNKKPDFYR